MILEISLKLFREVFVEYLKINILEENNKNTAIIKKFIRSGTKEMKIDFIHSMIINVHVKDFKKATAEFRQENIERVSNLWLVYFLCKLVEDDSELGDEIIKIYMQPYSKKGYEAGEYFINLLTVFSHIDKGAKIKLSSLENFLSKSNKLEYAKGVKKSLTTTLTGLNDTKTFTIHTDAKNGIVGLDRLQNHLEIKGKHRRVKCPVCRETHLLNESNVSKIINIDGVSFKFVCLHQTKSKFIEMDCFRMDLSKYVSSKDKRIDKSMFVLNNFKKLIEGELDKKVT